MGRLVKPAVWTAAFLACAGAGAYLAAHTDPFPPGVDRPTGTGPTGATGPSPSASPVPVVQRWTGVMPAAARHDLYVGGSCRSRWRTELRLTIEPDGSVGGAGVSLPVGDASCDFPQAQEQADRIRMAVEGRLTRAGSLRVTFEHVTPVPEGSTDLGGFLGFLAQTRIAMAIDTEAAFSATFIDDERSDGNRGTYVVDGSLRVRCRSGCG
ncbi:MAG: hypothetical protein U0V56_02180 [Actinomycetota bacterium]